MCVIARSEMVEVIWIQEVCCIEPQQDINTIYATVALANRTQTVQPCYFILPNAIQKPILLTHTISDENHSLWKLWREIENQLGIRKMQLDGNVFQLEFLADSHKPLSPPLEFCIGENPACDFKFWPDKSYRKKLGHPPPFSLYRIMNVPLGPSVIRFSFRVHASQSGIGERLFYTRCPKIMKGMLEHEAISIVNPKIKKNFLYFLYYGKEQTPQYDIVCMGKPTDGWLYRIEGPDKHRPKNSDPELQFKWMNPNIDYSLPLWAQVFTPKGDFVIGIFASQGR
ncbi:MAG: hypothetical protein KKH94_01260 [Candidatus Omnitrophica bacterium]|nr:hypothetical protein [Candidatus Omnitrophota bacterium]